MAKGTTAASVDFAVISARVKRERQGTLLAAIAPAGATCPGTRRGRETRAPFRARSGMEA